MMRMWRMKMNIKNQIKSLKNGEVVKFKIEGLFFVISAIESCGTFYFLGHQGGNELEMLEIDDFLNRFDAAVLSAVFKYQEDAKAIDANAPFNPDYLG